MFEAQEPLSHAAKMALWVKAHALNSQNPGGGRRDRSWESFPLKSTFRHHKVPLTQPPCKEI